MQQLPTSSLLFVRTNAEAILILNIAFIQDLLIPNNSLFTLLQPPQTECKSVTTAIGLLTHLSVHNASMMVDNYIIGGISQSGQVIFEVMIAVKSIYPITNAILQYTPITARVSTTHGMGTYRGLNGGISQICQSVLPDKQKHIFGASSGQFTRYKVMALTSQCTFYDLPCRHVYPRDEAKFLAGCIDYVRLPLLSLHNRTSRQLTLFKNIY